MPHVSSTTSMKLSAISGLPLAATMNCRIPEPDELKLSSTSPIPCHLSQDLIRSGPKGPLGLLEGRRRGASCSLTFLSQPSSRFGFECFPVQRLRIPLTGPLDPSLDFSSQFVVLALQLPVYSTRSQSAGTCTMGLRARRGLLSQSDGLGGPSYGSVHIWLKCYQNLNL